MTNTGANFVGAIDPTYNILNSKIAIDGSNSHAIIQRRSANTGKSNGYYNNGSDVYFDISSASDLRSMLSSFAFIVKGHAIDEANLTLTNGVVATEVGLPWDSCAALLKGVQCRINGSSTPIEIYNNNLYDVSHVMRMVMEFSREKIEGADDVFFTPCFENNRETSTVLSTECLARSLNWLTDAAGYPIYHSRTWCLSMLFAALANPAKFAINRLEIWLTFKSPEEILFALTANRGTNRYYVDDLQLVTTNTQMSNIMANIELKQDVKNDNTQRIMYRFYDSMSTTYSSNACVYVNGVTNLDTAILAFPSTILSNGINKLQFTQNSLSSFNASYNSMMVPQTTVILDTLNRKNNGEAYQLYKMACRRDFNMSPWNVACDYLHQFGAELNPASDESFFIATVPFNLSNCPVISSSSELRFNTTQTSTGNPLIDSTNCLVYLIKIRWVYFQINSDGTTEKLYT